MLLTTSSPAPAADKFLRAVLDQNPHHHVQGMACILLASRLHRNALMAQRAKNTAQAEKLNGEADRLFNRVARDFTDVDWVRQMVLGSSSQASTPLMRQVLNKIPEGDAKAKGTYGLAMRLKQDADKAVNEDRAAGADKVYAEAEKLLERILKNHADVAYLGTRKLGDMAKGALFEIQHLSIGKPAPDIEAEDLDGAKFKLSDYRGKVVLLDFWGNW